MDRVVRNPGLCRRCRHARRVHGRPGSVFWLCGAHVFDPSMPKYPALPVRRCRHFNPPLSEPES
ncbi:MAG TPA: hypothetical protein VMN57_02710 [Anaerolineales bacterium]|nr:hypothetical protein [Anaerolineales bacterium]